MFHQGRIVSQCSKGPASHIVQQMYQGACAIIESSIDGHSMVTADFCMI